MFPSDGVHEAGSPVEVYNPQWKVYHNSKLDTHEYGSCHQSSDKPQKRRLLNLSISYLSNYWLRLMMPRSWLGQVACDDEMCTVRNPPGNLWHSVTYNWKVARQTWASFVPLEIILWNRNVGSKSQLISFHFHLGNTGLGTRNAYTGTAHWLTQTYNTSISIIK